MSFRKSEFLWPTIQSFAIHSVFILSSLFIVFPALQKEEPEPLKFNLKKVDPKPAMQRMTGGGGGGPSEFMNTIRAVKNSPAVRVNAEDVPVGSLIPEETRAGEAWSHTVPKPDLKAVSAPDRVDLSEALLGTQERALKESVPMTAPTRLSDREDALRLSQKHRLNRIQIVSSLGSPLPDLGFRPPQNMSLDPEEGMPGFTPGKGGFGPGGGSGGGIGGGTGKGVGDGVGDGVGGGLGEKGTVSKYESIDDFLDIEVYTYRDPSNPGDYFMIKIFAKKDVKVFNVMPKEILFTIDCSLSMSRDRLDEFKKGLRGCLENLNPGDLFNVIAFKDSVQFFSPESIPANPETIKQAERFVEALTPSERTDVYATFKEIVPLPLRRLPSNVILLSDGRPTYGVTDSRAVINSTTRLNHGLRPIFAFSGGSKVNRYLLDFIAYQNRGWSQFVKKTPYVSKGLEEFYDKIKDPIFIRLRYRLHGLNSREVFPTSLPDFYKNAEFTLYGKAEPGQDVFSMQLLGDVAGKTKELVFSRSLSKAPAGTSEIAKGWAFNKIYALISRMTTDGETPKLRGQIEALSNQFGIQTPYSSELEGVRD